MGIDSTINVSKKKKKKDSTISIFFILPALSLSIALSYSSLRSWLLINFKTFLFFYYFLGNQTEFFTRVFFFSISYWFPHQDHHHRIDFTKLVLLHSDVHTFPYPNPSIRYFFCKDLIWLESKTGRDPGPHSPNNEFIKCRNES